MNDRGVVSDGQRGVESHEMGGKVGKNSEQKSRNGNNLAKQNDAKSMSLASVLNQNAMAKDGKCRRFVA